MKNLIFATILLLSATLLVSCENQGTGSFFEDPPDCFYDSLFGCGTFDIPSDSSYYGYSRSFHRAATVKNKSSSAVLQSSVSRKGSSCRFKTPDKLNGKIEFKQLNDRVTLKIPFTSRRSVSLRGKTTDKGFSASSTGFMSLCSYSAKADFANRDKNKRRYGVNLKLRLNCLLQKSCELNYQGQAYR